MEKTNKKIILGITILTIFWITTALIATALTTPPTKTVGISGPFSRPAISPDQNKIAYLTTYGTIKIIDPLNIQKKPEQISLWQLMILNETTAKSIMESTLEFGESTWTQNNIIITTWGSNIAAANYTTKELIWHKTGSWGRITGIWTENNEQQTTITNKTYYWTYNTNTGTLLKHGKTNQTILRTYQNGNTRLTINQEKQLEIKNKNNQTIYTPTFEEQTRYVFITISNNGKYLLQNTNEKPTLKLVNLETRKETILQTPNPEKYDTKIATFSTDNNKILVFSILKTSQNPFIQTLEITEYNTQNGQKTRSWKTHDKNIIKQIHHPFIYEEEVGWNAIWQPEKNLFFLKDFDTITTMILTNTETTQKNISATLINTITILTILAFAAYYYALIPGKTSKPLKNKKQEKNNNNATLSNGTTMLTAGLTITLITEIIYARATLENIPVFMLSLANLALTITFTALIIITIATKQHNEKQDTYKMTASIITGIIASFVTLLLLGIFPWSPKNEYINPGFAIAIALIPASIGLFTLTLTKTMLKQIEQTSALKQETLKTLKHSKNIAYSLVMLSVITLAYFLTIPLNYEPVIIGLKTILVVLLLGTTLYAIIVNINSTT